MGGFSASSFAVTAFSGLSYSFNLAAPQATQFDPFNWQSATRHALQGRYTADPIIARMAQRTQRKTRW